MEIFNIGKGFFFKCSRIFKNTQNLVFHDKLSPPDLKELVLRITSILIRAPISFSSALFASSKDKVSRLSWVGNFQSLLECL